jgi:hypothetical protein
LIIQSISLSAIVGREIGNQGYKTWNCGKRKAKSMSLIALVMTFFSKSGGVGVYHWLSIVGK